MQIARVTKQVLSPLSPHFLQVISSLLSYLELLPELPAKTCASETWQFPSTWHIAVTGSVPKAQDLL